MEHNWNKKNVLWQLLYLVLYFVFYLTVCGMGAIHPIMFVLYQVVAGLLLTGVLVKSFDRIRKPGTALSFGVFMILIFAVIRDMSLWHCVPILVLAILAEAAGLLLGNEKWRAILIKSLIMSFGTFGYYGQIWFNRDYTYDCAVDEMPAGYAETLMDCSPNWALPVVVIAGIAVSVLIANLTAKLFHIEKSN